jgi:hypothetical protein
MNSTVLRQSNSTSMPVENNAASNAIYEDGASHEMNVSSLEEWMVMNNFSNDANTLWVNGDLPSSMEHMGGSSMYTDGETSTSSSMSDSRTTENVWYPFHLFEIRVDCF